MKIHQLVTSLVPGDAISNFVLFLQALFVQSGFESKIFSETVSSELVDFCLPLGDYPKNDAPENILVAHYSIASMGMVTLPYFRAKKILFYHNVTPYQYWLDLNSLAAFHCLRGRSDLPTIIPFIHYGIAFSSYSLQDLRTLGLKKTAWVPLRIDVKRLNRAPDVVTSRLFDRKTRQILLVGRVVPNKKIEDAIRIASIIPNVRLIVAGSLQDAPAYHYALREEALQRKVQCDFVGKISQEELNALYRLADIVLVTSDHEGFCVPILEAFYFRVPVIARASGAIPETANGGALLFDEMDPYQIAGWISYLLENPEVRSRLQKQGDQALRQHLEFPLKETLLKIIQEVTSMSPIPPLRTESLS